MNHTGALQDILQDVAKALKPGQSLKASNTTIRRLSAHCLQVERPGSALVTILTKPVWEVIGVQLVIGGEYTQRDHGLYNVPAVNAIGMKQRFADGRFAQTIMDEVTGYPCLDCCGSGVVGIQRLSDSGPDDVLCLACMGEGVVGRMKQPVMVDFLTY